MKKLTTTQQRQLDGIDQEHGNLGEKSILLSIAGGLAARAIEDALSRGLTVEIPSLGIRISKDGIREKSSRGDSFFVKPNA